MPAVVAGGGGRGDLTVSRGASAWARVVAAVAAVICVVDVVGNLAHLRTDPGTAVGGAAIGLGGLLLDLLLMFTRVSATVTDHNLRLSFFPFYRQRIPFADIADVGPVRHYTAVECGGVGARWNGRQVSLLWAPGDGVPVRTVDGREYRVVLPDAVELADRLRSALGHT